MLHLEYRSLTIQPLSINKSYKLNYLSCSNEDPEGSQTPRRDIDKALGNEKK